MEENKIILYKDEEGKVNVNVRFADEDVWLTREHLAEIYATTPQNISLHVGNIYQDQELSEEGTRKKFFLVRQEGKRKVQREIDHYNLDMIIALGYRVQSPIAVRFRRWATQRLHEYIQKGFTMDNERLKQGGNRYFKEPLTLINTLELYDVPQILVAADATGTNYLCTLYENDSEKGYLYLGVQISESRIMSFVGGQLDLRDAYVHPEVENALYIVTAKQDMLTATTPLQPQDVSEEMLPEAGYFYDASDLADETELQSDLYQLEVPAHAKLSFQN